MAYPYRHDREVRLMSEHFGKPEARRLSWWRENADGYKGLEKALEIGRDAVTAEVKESGLRGRGGAGFPTGVKWGFMPEDMDQPHYFLLNSDESEPGTFKDRELMRWTPHQVIEGCLIASYAIRAEHCYVYCRGEFFETTQILARAIEEAYEAGLAGDDILGSGARVDLTLRVGAGAYICGEETGLMESLEGKRGQPRMKPPFPAAKGVFGMPTTINNTETISSVPHIVRHGGKWYRQWGTEKSPGTKLFCVSGHVERPGNFELPLGFPMRELLEDVCGGIRDGKALKAVIPGGASVPYMTAEECARCSLDYEGVQECGSMLGCASVIVMDETTDIVKQTRRLVQFFAHESCGQCTPCREGPSWVEQIMRRIEDGRGTEDDLDRLLDLGKEMTGTTICVLSDSCAVPVRSSIEKFRDEYLALIRRGERLGVA